MTPTNHHQTTTYVDAYHRELTTDLRSARATAGSMRTLRGVIARTMVRMGVSMMPERPPVVDGRIIVLSRSGDLDLPEAA